MDACAGNQAEMTGGNLVDAFKGSAVSQRGPACKNIRKRHTVKAARNLVIGKQGFDLTQQGFLQLATNPSVFKDETVTMDAAWVYYDRLLEDERVYFVREPEGLEKAWKIYTRNQTYSHRVWNDAYLAAFAQTANLKIATFDKGFREYKETKLTILS